MAGCGRPRALCSDRARMPEPLPSPQFSGVDLLLLSVLLASIFASPPGKRGEGDAVGAGEEGEPVASSRAAFADTSSRPLLLPAAILPPSTFTDEARLEEELAAPLARREPGDLGDVAAASRTRVSASPTPVAFCPPTAAAASASTTTAVRLPDSLSESDAFSSASARLISTSIPSVDIGATAKGLGLFSDDDDPSLSALLRREEAVAAAAAADFSIVRARTPAAPEVLRLPGDAFAAVAIEELRLR
jgi:hypothetical protein